MTEFDLRTVYDENDLAELCLFSGGFINFGYWANIDINKPISQEERIQSSADLYQLLFQQRPFLEHEKVLEIGCGRGHGAALALHHQPSIELTALDLMSLQLKNAKETQNKISLISNREKKIFFVQGDAEQMPFKEAYFDKVYSVETAQHFPSINHFLQEVARILAPSGKFLLTTFFSCGPVDLNYLHPRFPYLAQGVDHFIPIDNFIEQLNALGFDAIAVKSIGENVWAGFDRWVGQTIQEENHPGAWSYNWIKAYEAGMVDYFIVSASR